MKIEVLSVPGCPHRVAALEAVRRALAVVGASASVEEVCIADEAAAVARCMPGSPTILVDGRDVEPTGRGGAFACRLYAGGHPVPPVEALEQALLRGLRVKADRL